MATKVNMLKLLLESRGLSQVTTRRPIPRVPSIALLNMPAPANPTARRRRKVITISMQDMPDIPHPVKITHLKCTSVTGFRPLPEA